MKKIIRLFGFSLVLIAVLLGIYKVLSWKDTSGSYISSIEQLQNTKTNTVDVVFLGSSHVYCGVAPHVLWREYGISAFDMSISGMDKYSEFYYTKYFLKYQNPKLICVDTFSFTFDRGAVLANEYRNMISMPSSSLQRKMVDEYIEDKKVAVDYKLKWPVIHTRYRDITKKDFVSSVFERVGKGENLPPASFTDSGSQYSANLDIREAMPISDDNRELIDRYETLFEKTGIPILFFSVPYEMSPEQVMITAGIEEYIRQKEGLYFMNGSKEVDDLLDVYGDFADSTHLNINGAEKFSDWLGKYILNLVNLPNHTGDLNYSSWDDELIYYNVASVNKAVNSIALSGVTPGMLLEEVMKHDFLSYIVTFDDSDVELLNVWENGIKSVLNIRKEENCKGKALIGIGEDYRFVNELNESEMIMFNRYDGAMIAKSVSGGYDVYLCNDIHITSSVYNISVAVYDNYNQELLGKWIW